MPLITCPDCTKQISDAAPACIHCGRPVSALTVSPPPAPPAQAAPVRRAAASPAPDDYSCPACGSDNVRRLSLVWREGETAISASTIGAGAGFGGGVGLGAARTAGTARTLASIGASPPKRDSFAPGGWLIGLGLFLAHVASTLAAPLASGLFLFVAGAGGWLALRAFQYNETEYPREVARWERLFRCNRCAHVFTPPHLVETDTEEEPEHS